MNRVPIRLEMPRSARELARYGSDRLTHSPPKLENWEHAEVCPTLRQLEAFANATHTPLLLQALRGQDMYLAGGIVMLLGALILVGTLISDLLLATLDPRIRFGAKAQA